MKRFHDPMVQGLALAAIALLLALAGVSWLTLAGSDRLLFPELARTALAEATDARRKIDDAVALGIPVAKLVGVDKLYETMKQSDDDIVFIAITSGERTLFEEGGHPGQIEHLAAMPDAEPRRDGLAPQQSMRDGYLLTTLPFENGTFHLGHDGKALNKPLFDNLIDGGVIALVSGLLAFEVMLLVVVFNVIRPAETLAVALRAIANGRSGDAGAIRLNGAIGAIHRRVVRLTGWPEPKGRERGEAPLVSVRLLAFLFVFAEELGRSFLPVYAGEFAAATPGLDPTLATGVVVGLHMSAVAVVMPFATLFYSRLGRTRLYALGALIASAGLVGTGLAGSYWELLAWRAVSAAGYATTFVACQGFVIENTKSTNRASGTAMMVGGITLADICGPAFGGVLAERFGQGQTYVFAALVAGLAAVIVTRLMAGAPRRSDGEAPRGIKLRDFAVAFANRRLAMQLVFAAIPAKVLLTGFLYYLLPVTLIGNGWREADVGRIVMLYGVVMLLGGPLFGRLTDRLQNHGAVVAAGAVLAALPLLAFSVLQDSMLLIASLIAVLALGCGQAMSISAQVSMVVSMASDADVRQGQAPQLTVLRFVERFGGGFGPMVAAPLAKAFDSTWAIAILGAYAAASALIYIALMVRRTAEGAR